MEVPRALPVGLHESSEKPPYPLLITQIPKEDYTDLSCFSVNFVSV
jgi:hypothetical protein